MSRFGRKTKLLILLFALFSPLLVAEIVLRIYHRDPLDFGDEPLWDSRDGTPPKNRFGYREENPTPQEFEPECTRILMLGDSFTYGWGVTRGEDRFSDLVEARLNDDAQRNGSSHRYHVYNAGTPASNPDFWLKYLKGLLPGYRPHLVIAVFFLRDGTDLPTSLQLHQEEINALRAKYTDHFLYDYSYVARFISDQLVQREFVRQYLAAFHAAYLGTPQQRSTWRLMQARLKEIHTRCRDAGLPFHMAIFPLLFGLDDYEYFPLEDEISAFAKDDGIPVFSLTPGFLGHDAETLWVSRKDQHPNEKAHAIAARTLYPHLRAALDEIGR